MQDNTIKVVTPQNSQEIIGVVTEGMDEADYVHKLEAYYGFSCVVRMMGFFTKPDFPSTSGGKNE